jgi:hypothetical protein
MLKQHIHLRKLQHIFPEDYQKAVIKKQKQMEKTAAWGSNG